MGMWETEPRMQMIEDDIQCLRKKLGIDPEALVLGTFGVVNPYKQIDVQLQAVKQLHEEGYRICFLIVGFIDREMDIYHQLTARELPDFVKVVENSSKKEYWDLVRLSDVCFSLRFPPVGEFSLSILELMACGKPVVINKHRYNVFIPEDVCIKIQNTRQKEDLISNTAYLYQNPDIRHDIGNRAKEYAQNNFSMAKMLEGYLKIIESYDTHRRSWNDLRGTLPWHLRPLNQRVAQETMERFIQPVPDSLLKELEQALDQNSASSLTGSQLIPALTS
jgi:glycosyltransferase involved in cell wall biosynthesis